MIRLKLQEMSDDSIENSATNATALRADFGTAASRHTMRYTGGAVATEYPVRIISVICIVKATRSQKPAPNHVAACMGVLPTDSVAVKTMRTATSASAKASGNHVSNQSDSRSPARDSQDPANSPRTSMRTAGYQMSLVTFDSTPSSSGVISRSWRARITRFHAASNFFQPAA